MTRALLRLPAKFGADFWFIAQPFLFALLCPFLGCYPAVRTPSRCAHCNRRLYRLNDSLHPTYRA